METTVTLPKPILDEIAHCEAKIASLHRLVAVTSDAQALANEIGNGAQVDVSSGNFAAWLRVTATSMDAVAEIRRAVARAGYRLERTHEYPDDSYFNCIHRRDGVDGRLILCVILPRIGSTCRYVQVGTKEVPVMELRCGDAK